MNSETFKFSKRKSTIPTSTENNNDNDSLILRTCLFEEYEKNQNSLISVIRENFPSYKSNDPLIKDVLNLNLNYDILDKINIHIEYKKNKRKKDYKNYKYYDFLREKEIKICCELNIPPEKYLRNLSSIMNYYNENYKPDKKIFNKSDAQNACINIDVNKASALCILFKKFEWIN
jgi:hypothetical protein